MAEWPLMGHRHEFSLVRTAILDHRGVLITGPSGVGRTTLAMMGAEVAEDAGMAVVRVAGTEVWRSLPFGAFASVLPPDPGGDREGREHHVALLGHYARSLVDGAGGRPLMVCVDDAQLLDVASAMLVHQLARTRAATILATALSKGHRGPPTPAPIVALWKDDLVERVELSPLDDDLIEDILVSVLGGPVDPASVRQFAERSLGNPLFLRELVTGAMEAGALSAKSGSWRLQDGLRPTARLVELVSLRFGELTAPEREAMELTALGQPLCQSTLDKLADPAAVKSLEDRGLITSSLEGRRLRIGMAHPVYGEVVRAGIGARRERVLARSLAEASVGRRREDTLLQASLRLVGGGGSAELLLAGAQAARIRHDHSLTERLARAAIDKGDRFEARLLAAETAHLRGRPEQADRELVALEADAVSESERVRVAVLRFDNAIFLRGRADSRKIDELSLVVGDPSLRDELLARQVYLRSIARGPRHALETVPGLLDDSRAAPHTALRGVLGRALTRVGRLDDALEILSPHAGGEGGTDTAQADVRWNLYGNRSAALLNLGRLGEAEDLLSSVHVGAMAQPADERAIVASAFAALYLSQGRVQSAYLEARSSYSLFLELGRPAAARWPYAAAAMALALSGQAVRAESTMAEMDALGLPQNLGGDETDILQARCWVASAGGDLGAARRHLQASADLGREIGDGTGESRALHGLARLGRARQVTDRLDALAAAIDGELVAARARYVRAVYSKSVKELEGASADFEGLGALLFAAEALGEAAVLLRRHGDTREATAVEHRARRLLGRCEGAVTPLVGTIWARSLLTPAELDTALQAVDGSSDKEIAGRMHLSVRTIENRLHRTYQKLGVTRRHELADALRDFIAQ